METCKIMHCKHRGHCNLEKNGATDLCPVLQGIVSEAKMKTELAWLDKHPSQVAVPLDHFKGTRRTLSGGFSLEFALGKLAALELSRMNTSLEEVKRDKKYNTTPTKVRKAKGTRQTWGRGPKSIPVHLYPHVKLESYSVYEFKQTPPEVPKTEIVKTQKELFEQADRKESNRVHNIMVGRGLTIERLMHLME